jgi:cell division cycle protein 37
MTQRSFDYSKWDNIELSDDESDLHPNIDKDSWFRMKHRTRLEREQREDEDVKNWTKLNEQENNRIQTITARLAGLKELIAAGDEEAELEDQDALQGELADLKKQVDERNKKIAAIKERRSWNIDNICQVKEEKTFVNSANISSLKATDFAPTGQTEAAMEKNKSAKESVQSSTSKSSTSKSSEVTTKDTTASSSKADSAPPLPTPSIVPTVPRHDPAEKKSAISYNDYVLKHEDMLEFYSEIPTLEKTEAYLVKNGGVLLHEHSQSYMLLSCLEDEMNGKHKRMKLVCRQSQILSHVSELAQSMGRDPRDVVIPFFRRIEEKEHKKGFDDAVKDFIKRIQERAVVKKKEMDLERANEEEESPPLGPGGLCPVKTLQALPTALREAFESQEVSNLHKAIGDMTAKEARKWMKMCVDAGLWVAEDPHEFDEPVDEDDDNKDEVDE